MEPFVIWLKETSVASFVNGEPWVWPASETLHFIGLTLLVGTISLLDLRMLGFFRSLPVAPLHRLVPWGVLGFGINVITGALFFIAAPEQYINNSAFHFKLLFMVFAGINVVIFYVRLFPETEHLAAGEDAPVAAKVVAGVSLFLWAGVMYFGRMLPFIGEAF
jgi:uncharacterized membrane protein